MQQMKPAISALHYRRRDPIASSKFSEEQGPFFGSRVFSGPVMRTFCVLIGHSDSSRKRGLRLLSFMSKFLQCFQPNDCMHDFQIFIISVLFSSTASCMHLLAIQDQ